MVPPVWAAAQFRPTPFTIPPYSNYPGFLYGPSLASFPQLAAAWHSAFMCDAPAPGQPLVAGPCDPAPTLPVSADSASSGCSESQRKEGSGARKKACLPKAKPGQPRLTLAEVSMVSPLSQHLTTQLPPTVISCGTVRPASHPSIAAHNASL